MSIEQLSDHLIGTYFDLIQCMLFPSIHHSRSAASASVCLPVTLCSVCSPLCTAIHSNTILRCVIELYCFVFCCCCCRSRCWCFEFEMWDYSQTIDLNYILQLTIRNLFSCSRSNECVLETFVLCVKIRGSLFSHLMCVSSSIACACICMCVSASVFA